MLLDAPSLAKLIIRANIEYDAHGPCACTHEIETFVAEVVRRMLHWSAAQQNMQKGLKAVLQSINNTQFLRLAACIEASTDTR